MIWLPATLAIDVSPPLHLYCGSAVYRQDTKSNMAGYQYASCTAAHDCVQRPARPRVCVWSPATQRTSSRSQGRTSCPHSGEGNVYRLICCLTAAMDSLSYEAIRRASVSTRALRSLSSTVRLTPRIAQPVRPSSRRWTARLPTPGPGPLLPLRGVEWSIS